MEIEIRTVLYKYVFITVIVYCVHYSKKLYRVFVIRPARVRYETLMDFIKGAPLTIPKPAQWFRVTTTALGAFTSPSGPVKSRRWGSTNVTGEELIFNVCAR
jgi:hypothetical protein